MHSISYSLCYEQRNLGLVRIFNLPNIDRLNERIACSSKRNRRMHSTPLPRCRGLHGPSASAESEIDASAVSHFQKWPNFQNAVGMSGQQHVCKVSASTSKTSRFSSFPKSYEHEKDIVLMQMTLSIKSEDANMRERTVPSWTRE